MGQAALGGFPCEGRAFELNPVGVDRNGFVAKFTSKATKLSEFGVYRGLTAREAKGLTALSASFANGFVDGIVAGIECRLVQDVEHAAERTVSVAECRQADECNQRV